MSEANNRHDILSEQAAKIVASGALGRSRSYVRLLEFLVACTLEGRTPKEHEIATRVFNRGADFDPSQDAMVRVYAHHLRQKIDNFYAGPGRDQPERITIPKGEYRVVVTGPEAAQDEGPPLGAPVRRAGLLTGRIAGAALALAVAAFAAGWLLRGPVDAPPTPAEVAAASPMWKALLDDSIPTLVVVGDYYIFGELDEIGNVDHLIRNFSINSSKDLDELLMYQPELTSRYIDLDLTYLPRSTAFALRDLLRVLYTSEKPVRIVSMSELDAADLRANHILYVGYISALDKLFEFVFSSSALRVGDTYDELVDKASGKVYMSEAGMSSSYRNYRDYGLLSTFAGPNGNQFMIVAGTRDAGVMQTAFAVTDPPHLKAIEQAAPASGPASFEVLLEVTGLDRTNLDAQIVHSAPLEEQPQFSDRLLAPEG